MSPPTQQRKGRGTSSKPDSRYLEHNRVDVDDGWSIPEPEGITTQLLVDTSCTIITRNQSPDIPFDRSINPYKGCEHGCVYCFARPTHAYLDLSPGIDFESIIFYKPDAPNLLIKALSRPGYQAAPLALGVNTDAYQPVERKLKVTREVLSVLKNYRHPVSIVTKSSLIERDVDLLAPMAAQGLVQVVISVTTLDPTLSRRMEPRAVSPARRLNTIRTLTQAGIPTGILFAPVIPAINDHEIEAVLSSVSDAGAQSAAYVMLRLPHEVKDLFLEWLQAHYPLKAERVMSIIRNLRGGKAYDSRFGERLTGAGEFATLIAQRFKLACKKNGLNQVDSTLNTHLFKAPPKAGDQLTLF